MFQKSVFLGAPVATSVGLDGLSCTTAINGWINLRREIQEVHANSLKFSTNY